MNEGEVDAELRLAGVADRARVKLATVENDGEVSVILQDWAEPLQKRDLEADEPRRGHRPRTRRGA